jgi:para-nitrobenzyl esterase
MPAMRSAARLATALPLLALPLLALLACAAAPPAPEKPAEPAPTLLDRTWELVRVRFPDGSELAPAGTARYTLRLAAGRVEVVADCNRAASGYTLEGQGLSFGAFAATRAACPPGSISDAYLMQLGFVRSYALTRDRLYLASLVDGSVLEFR